MNPPKGLAFREASLRDKTFVAFSWLASFEKPWLQRRCAGGTGTPLEKARMDLPDTSRRKFYREEMKRVIEKAMQPPNRVVVLFDEKAPGFVAGWAISTPDGGLLYCYTLKSQRRLGVATALIRHLCGANDEPLCAFMTEAGLLLVQSLSDNQESDVPKTDEKQESANGERTEAGADAQRELQAGAVG